jgi:WD40 repeat protein
MESIRVFVSSTFRDMHAERDHLTRKVFPRLLSECMRRGADFVAIDLRWGITQEESAKGLSPSLCLREIDRCRPFFISLLGDRYGWISLPEEIQSDVFERAGDRVVEEWYELDETAAFPRYLLRQDRAVSEGVKKRLIEIWKAAGLAEAGDSITAREIHHGAFHPDHSGMHAFLYLRKPGLTQHPDFPAPAPDRNFRADFVEEDESRRERLESLKETLRVAGREGRAVVREYEVEYAGLRIDLSLLREEDRQAVRDAEEDGAITREELQQLGDSARAAVLRQGAVVLSRLENFGETVYGDLWAAIEPYFESDRAAVDPFARQGAYHEAFLRERTRMFFGRRRSLGRMSAYVRGGERREALVVTGPPGSGKSALMAQCVLQVREEQPDALVLPFFIGSAPESSDPTQMVLYLCEVLRRECAVDEALPTDPESFQTLLPTFLAKAAGHRRVVLFIDALNQLDPAGRSHEMNWLPTYVPENARLIVSTLPGDCLDALSKRVSEESVLEVPALPKNDRKTLITERLTLRAKKLTEDQQRRLLDCRRRRDAALPLYLAVALEELCLFGRLEELDERLDRLPPTLKALFGQVLDRLEPEHRLDRVKPVLSWLAVARSGMLESEILGLIERNLSGFGTLHWAELYCALEFYLRPRGDADSPGRIDFYHDQLRLAVAGRYFGTGAAKRKPGSEYRKAHGQIAEYFLSVASGGGAAPPWQTDQERAFRELPYHLVEAGRAKEARRLLLDFDWIEAKLEATDVTALIADYALMPDDAQLRSVQGALLLAAPLLSREKEQLAAQLLGRLMPGTGEVRSMLEQARRWKGASWLRPLTRSLRYPGEPSLPFIGISAAAVAADLQRFVFGSGDGTVKVWNRTANEPSASLGDYSARNAVALTPDGRIAISSTEDGSLLVWAPLQEGRKLGTLKGHTGAVTAVALSGDGRRAVSAAEDQRLLAWNLDSLGEPRFLGYVQPVTALAITGDGARAISASRDGALRVWNTEGLADGRTFSRHGRRSGEVRALAATSDGIAVAASGKSLEVWDIETGSKLRTLRGHTAPVRTIALLPDGRRALSGSDDITMRMWDLQSERGSVQVYAHDWSVTAVSVTPDGGHAVSASDDETLKLWDLEKAWNRKTQPVETLRGPSQWVNSIALTPDGRLAVTASRDRAIKVWDVKNGELLRTLGRHEAWVNAVAVTPDGKQVLSGGDDNSLRAWDLETGAELKVLAGYRNGVSAVAVTPDGRRAVTGCWDQTLEIWELATYSGHHVNGHRARHGHGWIRAVAVTPDSSRMISASHDGTLKTWDLDSGEELRVLRGHEHWVMAVAVFPDGRRAISGAADKTLRIWDLESGEEVSPPLEGHTGYVTGVALMPGGRYAVSTSEDQTLRIWDLQKGRSVASFTADGQLRACAVTPDGSTILAGESSGRLHFLHPELQAD